MMHIPLLAAQEGIWLGQALDPRSADFVTAECVELSGAVDLAALAAATQRALEEADILRSQLVKTDSKVVLAHAASGSLPAALVTSADERAARAWMQGDVQTPFDLMRGPLARHALLRLPDGRVFWYIAAHHLAFDGYAYTLVIQRAGELYGQLTEQREATSTPFTPLAAARAEEGEYARSQQAAGDAAFWQEQLRDRSEPAQLTRAQASYPAVPRRESFEIDAQAFARLQPQPRGPSWVHALTALFASYVQHKTSQPEVVLGLPVLARTGRIALRSPVMMMNIIPVRIGFADGATLQDRSEQTRRVLESLLPHARYRYEQMRRDLGRVGSHKALFGPVLNIMPFERSPRFAGLQTRSFGIAAGPVEDLSVSVHPLAQRAGLHVTIDAHPERYDQTALAAIAGELRALLTAPFPLTALRSVARLREDIVLHGPPLAEPARDVVERIQAVVRAHGQRVAVSDGAVSLRYEQLWREASALAEVLRREGVGAGALVGLWLPRSCDGVVAILATLLVGAGYVPLDPEGPRERARAVLRDAKPQLVIVPEDPSVFPFADETPVLLKIGKRGPTGATQVFPPLHHEQTAYVIYTSGSTGRPNGVVVSRAALAHFVAAAIQQYGITSDDRILQFASWAFDASVEEMFVALGSGAELVLRTRDMVDSPAQFLNRCEQLKLSVLDLPTAFFHELAFAIAQGNSALPGCVRTVIIGGEAALPARVREFVRATGGHVKLLNTYGPTEATVVATCCDLSNERALDASAQLPIGRPLPGIEAILVPVESADDEHLYRLLLAGPTLAMGYLRQPQLTAERFTRHSQRRSYQTGDLVRLRDDGLLCFVRRNDDQLKISGHRIELGEVERALTRHPAVQEAAALVQRVGPNPRLVAHVACAADLTAAVLREHARSLLLAGAVPSAIVLHRALPRTAAGKIDRKALQALSVEPSTATVADAGNELERAILAVWREVLGSLEIGLEQDFFELGGQSLQSIQVAGRLSVKLGREVTGALLFRHPTVRGLAQALQGEAQQTDADDVRAQVLEDARLDDAPLHGARDRGGRAVLLTGATGFLGAHLLHTLLHHSDREVICVVRGKDREDARMRLRAALSAQQLPNDLDERVRIVVGDLSREQLGLSDEPWTALQRDCQIVIHNGASVSLARGYGSLRAVNVAATRALIGLVGAEPGKSFHYVSTLATALGAGGEGTIEERFVDYHAALRDGYSQSKWASEQLLSQAFARGVRGQIYRLGRLVGPLGSAVVNTDDLVWRMVVAGVRAGALPQLPVREPWTPVDIVARLIVAEALTARADDAPPVMNVAPPILMSLTNVTRWTRSYGYKISASTPSQFVQALRAAGDSVDGATLAMFETQQHAAIPSIRSIDTRRCQRAMTRAQLIWPAIAEPQLHRYLDRCVRDGLLGKPPARESHASPAPSSSSHRQ